MNQQRKGWGGPQMVLLMAVFGLPVVFAWLLYFNPDLLPGGRSNKGELIQPVHPFPDQIFSTLSGGNFSRGDLTGYWTLLYSGGEVCDSPCQKRIYDMRQIRKAMAEHHGEVRRVVLFSGSAPMASFTAWESDYSGTVAIVDSEERVASLRSVLVPVGGDSVGHLYLIDPMGNLMMHYQPEQPAAEVLSDMELLLKVNKWGGGH